MDVQLGGTLQVSSKNTISLLQSAGEGQVRTVHAADIEAAYLSTGSAAFDSGSGNSLLLKNGWAYLGLKVSPLSLPAKPPQQQAGDGWARWRIAEQGWHEIQHVASGLWKRVVGAVVDISQKTPVQVTGDYQSTWVSEDATITSWRGLQMSADGTFTKTRETLASSGMQVSDTSFILHSSNSVAGCLSSFSGLSRSQGGSSVSTASQRQILDEHAGDMFGTYRILEDGMTLELNYASGKVQQQLYMRTQAGDLSIGGQSYWREGDVAPDLMESLFLLLSEGGNQKQWLELLTKALREANKSKKSSESAVMGAPAAGGSKSL